MDVVTEVSRLLDEAHFPPILTERDAARIAVHGGNHTTRDGALEAERVADRDRGLPDLESV